MPKQIRVVGETPESGGTIGDLTEVLPGVPIQRIAFLRPTHAVVLQTVAMAGGYIGEHLAKAFFNQSAQRAAGTPGVQPRPSQQLVVDVNGGLHRTQASHVTMYGQAISPPSLQSGTGPLHRVRQANSALLYLCQ